MWVSLLFKHQAIKFGKLVKLLCLPWYLVHDGGMMCEWQFFTLSGLKKIRCRSGWGIGDDVPLDIIMLDGNGFLGSSGFLCNGGGRGIWPTRWFWKLLSLLIGFKWKALTGLLGGCLKDIVFLISDGFFGLIDTGMLLPLLLMLEVLGLASCHPDDPGGLALSSLFCFRTLRIFSNSDSSPLSWLFPPRFWLLKKRLKVHQCGGPKSKAVSFFAI